MRCCLAFGIGDGKHNLNVTSNVRPVGIKIIFKYKGRSVIMKIVVPIKQVPETSNVKMDQDGDNGEEGVEA